MQKYNVFTKSNVLHRKKVESMAFWVRNTSDFQASDNICRAYKRSGRIISIRPLFVLLFTREDDPVVSAKMHECKETEKPVVIGIEVAVFERFMTRIPQGVDKLFALFM